MAVVPTEPDWLLHATATGVPPVAIGVAILRTEHGNLHTAVLHRGDSSQPPQLLSQDWHHRLANDAPPPGCRWVDARLPPARAVAFAALCRRVYRRNRERGIPYGIRYEGGRVLPDGLVELAGLTHGLTCATFVMLVFEHAGVPLLEPSTWPARADDAAWHQEIVALLERTRVPREHVETVRQELGCARFRPEETAAACSCDPRPTRFEAAAPRGLLVRGALGSPVGPPTPFAP